MARPSIDVLAHRHFMPLLDIKDRYVVLYGGRGSGKSEFLGRLILFRCMKEGGHNFLVVRKVARDNDDSTVKVIRSVLAENDIPDEYNKTTKELRFDSMNGLPNRIVFDGLDNRERLKSKKGITSVWIEEATALTLSDFTQVDLILRDPTPFPKQIYLSFNPDEAEGPWLKEEFFEDERPYTGPGKKEDSYLHHSTVEHNPIKAVRDEYVRQLDRLSDAVLRKIYRDGVWALAKGIIYGWPIGTLPSRDPEWYDEVIYGVDFGFSVDPAAVVRIYRKADKYWVEQVVYQTELTNRALGALMRERGVTEDDTMYCDSAEPKSIQDLYEMGFDAREAEKGPDSVRAGIDLLKTLDITIVEGSTNIIEERKKYKWQEDKNERMLNKPVKFDDHAMDAIRYAIYTHSRGASSRGFDVF